MSFSHIATVVTFGSFPAIRVVTLRLSVQNYENFIITAKNLGEKVFQASKGRGRLETKPTGKKQNKQKVKVSLLGTLLIINQGCLD